MNNDINDIKEIMDIISKNCTKIIDAENEIIICRIPEDIARQQNVVHQIAKCMNKINSISNNKINIIVTPKNHPIDFDSYDKNMTLEEYSKLLK